MVIEEKIVHDGQAHGQHFLCLEEMPEIGSGIQPANRTLAVRVNRAFISGILFILIFKIPLFVNR
jgi:hypothetical protein